VAELTPQDVADYTNNRLPADDPETQRLLDYALAAVRNYCEWHVTPPRDETLVFDGEGSRILVLPTMYLVELKSVEENGHSLDVSGLVASAYNAGKRTPVRLRKRSGGVWAMGYSNIVVEMTHGFDEEDAADFRLAVLDAVDRFAQTKGNVSVGGLKRYDVDDVKREWFDPRAGDFAERVINERLVEPYRILLPH